MLHQTIDAHSITSFFRKYGRGGSKKVEMISIVGKDALADFCKDYSEKIEPNPKDIQEESACLYATTDRGLEYILHKED